MMPAARTAPKKSRHGGAGRRGQAYGNDGSSGTDEDFSDHESSPVRLAFTLRTTLVHIMDTLA